MDHNEEKEKIKADILIDMLKRNKIGDTHHTALDNIPKGFPQRQRKLVIKEAKKLMKKGIISRHPTNHGIKTSINPECLEYIINLPLIKATINDGFTLQNFKKFLK